MEGGDHREAGGQEWTVLAPISIHNCDLEDVIGCNCFFWYLFIPGYDVQNLKCENVGDNYA